MPVSVPPVPSPATTTSLRAPGAPSPPGPSPSPGRYFGMMNSEMPFVPAIGRPSGPGTLASTRWTMFWAASWSPAEIHILLPTSR